MTPSAARLGVPVIFLLLSGCVGGLLGGGKPDQLYRFGTSNVGASSEISDVNRRSLSMPAPTFAPEISADRILTSKGRELAYLKDVRWVTSTPALYQMAVEASIRARSAIVFVDRAQARSADGELRVSIDRFEAVYGEDPSAPPTIHVEGRASLFMSPHAPPSIHRIHSLNQATANTAGAVAEAFDAAVGQSTSDLSSWVSATLPRRTAQFSKAL